MGAEHTIQGTTYKNHLFIIIILYYTDLLETDDLLWSFKDFFFLFFSEMVLFIFNSKQMYNVGEHRAGSN